MSIYNEDELQAPAWINQKFLETILQNYEHNDNIKISDFTLSPACVKGDHYASVMFRCKLNYVVNNCESAKYKSIIIKTLPMEEGMKRELLMSTKLFETEISMYSKTLPQIEKILAEYGEATKLSAEIIYHSLDPYKVVVFEDLCESGYETVRSRYLNEYEIKTVYRKLAKLHAVSYKMGHSESADENEITNYQDGLFTSPTLISEDIMSNSYKQFIEVLTNTPDFNVYLEKIRKMQPELKRKCRELYEAFTMHKRSQQCDVYVLNHGDFHMKNLMFKFNDDKEIEDLIMVDYQISCYAPSTVDLTYSQYMLMSPEFRLRRNEFMQYYFEEFLSVLKKIHFEGTLPLYSDIQIASLKYRHFSIFLLFSFFPMAINFMVSSADDLKDIDGVKLMENPELMMSIFCKNPKFIQEIRSFMPILLKEGYMD